MASVGVWTQHLSALGSVFEGVKPGGVHAQQPVAYGAAESCLVERLVVVLRLQVGKPFADGFVCHRRDPQPFHWAMGLGLLHHPTLYQFTLLAGIAAVHYAVGGLHQSLDGIELLGVALVVDELDAETFGNHGQGVEAPRLPPWRIVVGLFQGAEVAVGPRHLIPVPFHVAVMARGSPQYAGYVAGHRWFLGNTDYHTTDNVFSTGLTVEMLR